MKFLRAAALPDGVWQIVLPATARPEPVIASLGSAGASLVSAAPQLETLEDMFVRRIASADGRSREAR